MRSGSWALGRTADAIAALAAGDREGYGAALAAIVHDFQQRRKHLTGVPIADTAMMSSAGRAVRYCRRAPGPAAAGGRSLRSRCSRRRARAASYLVETMALCLDLRLLLLPLRGE